MWTVELLAALGLFLAVAVALELTLPAAREAARSFGLVLSGGFGCLGQPGTVC
jgi:hypothetical protein